MPNVTITKTDPSGMTHNPAGNPINVPEGGTVTIINRRRRRVKVRVRMDDEITYEGYVPPNGRTVLTVGSAELPDGHYDVIDPPSLLRLVGKSGASFRFK